MNYSQRNSQRGGRGPPQSHRGRGAPQRDSVASHYQNPFVRQMMLDLDISVNNFLQSTDTKSKGDMLTNNIKSLLVNLLLYYGCKIADINLMKELYNCRFQGDVITVAFYGNSFLTILDLIRSRLQRVLLEELGVNIQISLIDVTKFLIKFVSHNGNIIFQIILLIENEADIIDSICNPVVQYSKNIEGITWPYNTYKSDNKQFHITNYLYLSIDTDIDMKRNLQLLKVYAEIKRILVLLNYSKIMESIILYFMCYPENGAHNLPNTDLISLITGIKYSTSTNCCCTECVASVQYSKYIKKNLTLFPLVLVELIHSYMPPLEHCSNWRKPNSPSKFCSNLVLQIDTKIICFNCILTTLRNIILNQRRFADTFNVGELLRLCSHNPKKAGEILRLCSIKPKPNTFIM